MGIAESDSAGPSAGADADEALYPPVSARDASAAAAWDEALRSLLGLTPEAGNEERHGHSAMPHSIRRRH